MQTKHLVWVLLALPGIYMVPAFVTGAIGYGETIHLTGQWSVGLLLVALAATPLRRILGGRRLPRFFLTYRRPIGVAAFAYAALHLGVYLERKWGAGLILREGLELDLATGWLAFAVMLVLAVTSNDASVRALGRRWKRLHRAVYLGAALTFAHWVLATFDTIAAYVCLVLLLLLEAVRFLPSGK